MTQTKELKETQAAENRESRAAEERTVQTVRWDDSKMTSTYANVCNVSSTREEVTLLFGTNQTWLAGQRELAILLANRIILNPYAAKRLSLLLSNIIREYESRFGALKTD